MPPEGKDKGIGFCRYSKKSAEKMCPPALPFCLVMDDSVHFWTARLTEASLADVLLYFQLGSHKEGNEMGKRPKEAEKKVKNVPPENTTRLWIAFRISRSSWDFLVMARFQIADSIESQL